MSKVFIVQKKHVQTGVFIALVAIVGTIILNLYDSKQAKPVSGSVSQPRVIQLVTGEFDTTGADGKEIEVYRWDPGTIIVNKGEEVELQITGINGNSHPFVIEGLGIRGEVVKGKTTIVRFKADKPGTYPIVCLTHTDMRHSGPMVGYIFVH